MTKPMPFVPNEGCFVPLHDFFASEIREVANSRGIKLSSGHAFEIVAAFHNFQSYAALRANGLMSLDRYACDDFQVNPDQARERAIAIKSKVAQDFDPIEQRLEELQQEACTPDTALAVRLTRNICLLTNWNTEIDEFDGRTLLSPEDHEACAEVATRDKFEDGMWNQQGFPTVAAIFHTKEPLPQDKGYRAIIADPVLNVAWYLAPDRTSEIVERYRVSSS